jgi:protein ImuA
VLAGELGRPSAAGLRDLGLDPARLIMAEPARAGEALLAIEEGLRSGGLALVAGVLDAVALTPARRLSLAAAAGRTPCLLITHPASEAAAATATRWRIGHEASAPHPFDPRAPGARRFTFEIERCRAGMRGAGLAPLSVEWSDEAHHFAVAAGLAGHVSRPARARRGP